MLLAWDRFDEFTALLKDADIFSFVQTLKDHCGSLDTGAVDKAVTDTGQILLVSHEAAAHDRVGEAARLPPQGVSADVATYDPGHAEAEAVSAIVAPEPSANVSAEALLEIFSLLNPNSQWRGRDWVADGCPTVIRPDEHFIIAENLAPFRDTARNASPTERQRFLDMTAPQMTGRAEEAA